MGAYNELGTFCILLRNLLALDCMCVFFTEGQVGDGHIIQDNVEEECTLCQYSSDVSAHNLLRAKAI